VPFAFVIPAWLAIRTYGKKAGLALPAHPNSSVMVAVSPWPIKGQTSN